mgnify:FL=1
MGKPLSLRVGLHMQGFKQSSFLVAGSGSVPGDENSRFLGDVTVSLTGPDVVFVRGLELYLGIFNASNQNKRQDAGRTDPTVILSLADVGVGLKGGWTVAKGISVGGNVGVRFFNSISDVTANFDATNVNVDGIFTFDVRKYAPMVPLRLHVNFGYILDNSVKLLPTGQCANSTGNDSCIRSRVVETFAYGLNNSRLRTALAIELPIRPHVPWGIFGIAPFVEYHIDAALGDGDTTVGGALGKDADSQKAACGTDAACLAKVDSFRNRVQNRIGQYLTVGLRLRPVSRLVVDVGVDLALQSPGFQFGPPIPAWNVVAGAAWAFDMGSPKAQRTTRTVTKVYETASKAPVAKPEGRVAGTVVDAKTKKPVPGAVIKYAVKGLTAQSAGDDGTFRSEALPPGPVQFTVTAPEYEVASEKAVIDVDTVRKIEVALKALPPKEGKVRIRVTDDKTNPLPGATARSSGPVARDATYDGELLVVQLPEGTYGIAIEAPGYLSKEKQVKVAVNSDQTIELSLSKRPLVSHVEIKANEIVIKGTIHFANNAATILPDGQQILNEVVDVLAKNPQIRKVSIEGHTDNVGDAAKNLQLSKDRAKAVMDYMVKSGIAQGRLTSEGFGQDKPLVPNNSASNKAKNRRVEFRIIDQAAAPTP